MSEEMKQPMKAETIKLKQAHTHAGKDYKAGDEIKVAPHVAEYLRRRGKA